jgi:hypothetical protein
MIDTNDTAGMAVLRPGRRAGFEERDMSRLRAAVKEKTI